MILERYTAGDPMRPGVLWTDLTRKKIGELLRAHAIHVGDHVVKQLLKMGGYVKRKMLKCMTLKEVGHRNEQFEHIALLREGFIKEGLPVLSMDSKKKEMLGNFYRDGRLYAREAQKVYDHDFNSFSGGVIIPHGIYDTGRDKCYLTIGRTKDTAEFVCDNIEHHWNSSIKCLYPSAKKMLILCDGGGSNSCRHYVVKEQLQGLSGRIGMDIVIAHYPAYCSKWNPIEHRAFCHITRAWQGVVFDSYGIVGELAEKATTRSGFSVEVSMNEKVYATGKKASEGFRENMPVEFDGFLPKWNYTLRCQT
ncbi:MAG TPA: ISAzo13 family transposase [Pricia sp.]|nr:ISAzo13 family transposase [Pricia sp.]